MIQFIGAGPGDPDLITVKGKKGMEEADIIIYAGSLVNPALLACAKDGAAIYNSAGMVLEEVLEVMIQGDSQGKRVARVHTGDPSLYGAIRDVCVSHRTPASKLSAICVDPFIRNPTWVFPEIDPSVSDSFRAPLTYKRNAVPSTSARNRYGSAGTASVTDASRVNDPATRL